jgi:hypothetical protein
MRSIDKVPQNIGWSFGIESDSQISLKMIEDMHRWFAMPHSLSNDRLERVVAHVGAGHSCHHAAARFETSVSFVVNLTKASKPTRQPIPSF